MIGQTRLKNRIKNLREKNKFPHFSIFVGERGSGRKTFLSENFKGIYLENNKVDSVRKMINLVYKVSNQIFIMPDVDDMSNAAKNALLKVVEECPNNNYFIMTLEDENNTLQTIRSRATMFYMDKYTLEEIEEYAVDKALNPYTVSTEDEKEMLPIIRDLCETPGDVNILLKCGAQDFYDYVQLVVDNITEVSTANSFKIPSKVSLKKDAEGYDLKLFWKAFQNICMERTYDYNEPEEVIKYGNWILITSKYLQQLSIKGVNKQMLMDVWVLEIRAWM